MLKIGLPLGIGFVFLFSAVSLIVKITPLNEIKLKLLNIFHIMQEVLYRFLT